MFNSCFGVVCFSLSVSLSLLCHGKVSRESGGEVEWVTESNSVFPLTQYRESILEWVKQGSVIPSSRANEVISTLRGMLDDEKSGLSSSISSLSISRPRGMVPFSCYEIEKDRQLRM